MTNIEQIARRMAIEVLTYQGWHILLMVGSDRRTA